MHFSEGDDCPPAARYQSKQLLNNIVDGMSTIRPSALYAEIPNKSDTYDSGYRSITYRALANAINGVAWSLKIRWERVQIIRRWRTSVPMISRTS